jgi:hypothetical protein
VAATRGAEEPSEVESEVLDLLASVGPTSAREVPELLPQHERKAVRAALDRLQRRLLVTNAGLEESEGWPANVVDLVERRYADLLRAPPDREAARRTLAGRLHDSAGELSAADVAAVFAWRKKEAEAVLESLGVERREEQGVAVWRTAKRAHA